MFYYDPTFLLIIPALLLALFAQYRVNSTYANYSKVPASIGITGEALAERILANQNLLIKVESVAGELSDHYDPTAKVLRLSKGVYSGNSVAAMGIVAHEIGHAMQDAKAYMPLKLRNNFVPAANFGTNFAFPLFFVGIIAGFPFLMDLAILLFTFAVVFSVITLPVEFNASKRAMALLSDGHYLTSQELPMAKSVLSAAALTYVAATAMAVLNLIRLLILRRSRD
ncbi:MAG: zinc metallopeptidase [Candidatus Margulisiibacteriota bacterium]